MPTPRNDPQELDTPEAENRFFRELAARGETRSFARNAVLIREGDRDDCVFLIQAGWVRVLASETSEGGSKQSVIDEYGPGDFVGEMALDGLRRSATVIATEATKAIAVSRETVLAYLREHPEFSLSLITELIRRARLATANLKSVALKDVYGRIADLLRSLAVNDGGRRIIPGKLTKAEIARRVGASRDMVTLIMRDLMRGEYLEQADDGLILKRELPERW